MQTTGILDKLKQLFHEFNDELEAAKKQGAPQEEIDMLTMNVQKIGDAIGELENAGRKITDYLIDPKEDNREQQQ